MKKSSKEVLKLDHCIDEKPMFVISNTYTFVCKQLTLYSKYPISLILITSRPKIHPIPVRPQLRCNKDIVQTI